MSSELLSTAEAVAAHLSTLRNAPGWTDPAAYGLGLATIAGSRSEPKVLDCHFPAPNRGENPGFVALLASVAGVGSASGSATVSAEQIRETLQVLAPLLSEGSHPNATVARALADAASSEGLRNVPAGGGRRQAVVLTVIADLTEPPVDTYDAYLRLHLLSTRKVRPHEANLDGLFGLLNNVVWTDRGPFDPDTFEHDRLALRSQGENVTVLGVDKFPQMVDYVIPSGVRIANAARVRLGAYLGEGTTVMHEGFVNFNAGTEGPAMGEGRISAGVFVDANTDIGGGASIMGTLSGGGKEVIAVGPNSLLGANSGLGISLGANCVVEAGLYITAGTRVTLPDGQIVKAAQLSGRSDMLFRRDSVSGAVMMLPQTAEWGGLNTDLHLND